LARAVAAKANSPDAIDMLILWGHGSAAHLGGSATPGMWMLGQSDLMTPPRTTSALTEALTDSRAVVLEKSGHAMLSERPEQVLDQLIQIV